MPPVGRRNKAGTRTRKPRDPDLPKRPPNCFMLYKMDNNTRFSDDLREYTIKNKDISISNMVLQHKALKYASALLGARWKDETTEVKQWYQNKALERTHLYRLEMKANYDKKVLEKQMMKQKQDEDEEYAYAQWQDSAHNQTSLYYVPPFVEEENHQTFHTSPPLVEAPVDALNWPFNPMIHAQEPIAEGQSCPSPYTQYLQQFPATVPSRQQAASDFEASLGVQMVPTSSFWATQQSINDGQADGNAQQNLDAHDHYQSSSAPWLTDSDKAPDNSQIAPDFQSTPEDVLHAPALGFYNLNDSNLSGGTEFNIYNHNQPGMTSLDNLLTPRFNNDYTQLEGQNFVSDQQFFQNGLHLYQENSTQIDPSMRFDTSSTLSLEEANNFREPFDGYGQYMASPCQFLKHAQ